MAAVQILPAVYLNEVFFIAFLTTLLRMTVGNTIGGVVFVGMIKYNYARRLFD